MFREATEQELERLPSIDREKYCVIVTDLASAPHREEIAETRRGIHGSHIDVHLVDDAAVVDSKGEWAQVSCWTKHRGVFLEIVDLNNGMQIFTDDDPRAVYGFDPMTGEETRATPTEALIREIVVPVLPCSVDYSERFENQEYYDEFQEAYDRLCSLKLDGVGPCRIDYMEDSFLLSAAKITRPEQVKVISVQVTGHEVMGYDLSVPGSETFMSTDGIILSNTFGVFVPSLPEAVEDVKNKLMPSKQIFSIRDPEKVVNSLSQDLLLGLYNAATHPSKKTHVFETRADAMRAIQQGRVSLSDEVKINDEPDETPAQKSASEREDAENSLEKSATPAILTEQ